MFDKLVRDNIPDIIRGKGQNPITKVLDDKEYDGELAKKLCEEATEYLIDRDIEELADVLEVVYAIAKFKGVSMDELERIRLEKLNRNGGFDKKIYLDRVE